MVRMRFLSGCLLYMSWYKYPHYQVQILDFSTLLVFSICDPVTTVPANKPQFSLHVEINLFLPVVGDAIIFLSMFLSKNKFLVRGVAIKFWVFSHHSCFRKKGVPTMPTPSYSRDIELCVFCLFPKNEVTSQGGGEGSKKLLPWC